MVQESEYDLQVIGWNERRPTIEPYVNEIRHISITILGVRLVAFSPNLNC